MIAVKKKREVLILKKYLMVIYLAVMCLCMGVPVSAAQYSFAYSSAAVKTGTTAEIYIYKGKSKQNPQNFKWSTSDAKTVSVINGKVTAKKAGVVWVKAVKNGQVSKIRLYSYAKSKKVDFKSGNTGEVKAGDSLILVPSEKGVLSSYKSSNEKIATVSKDGKVTAKSEGKVKITYASYGKVKYTGTFSLTVSPALASFKVQDEMIIKRGDSADLAIEKTPANGYVKNIQYSSSNKKVASVTKDGKVLAQGSGYAKVTVQVDCGEKEKKSKQIRVYVVDDSYDTTSETKYIIHRGASLEAPENTLPAFEIAAQEAGYIETDVQRTKDGVFVISHDSTLKRMCGVDKKISDLTYKEILKYPVINGCNAEKYPDNYTPTLQQYLDVCSSYGAVPVIEVKWDMDEADVLKFNQIIQSSRKTPIVISFRVEMLKKLRLVNKLVDIQYIMRGGVSEETIKVCQQYKFDISVGYTKLSKGMIDKLHGKGINVAVWSIADQRLIGLYESLGVDFITVASIGQLGH